MSLIDHFLFFTGVGDSVPQPVPHEPMATSAPSGRGEGSSAEGSSGSSAQSSGSSAQSPCRGGRRRSLRPRDNGSARGPSESDEKTRDRAFDRALEVSRLVKKRLNADSDSPVSLLSSAEIDDEDVYGTLLKFLLEDSDTLSLHCTEQITARFLTYCYGKLSPFLYSTFA